MKLKELVTAIVVDPRKLTDYALNPDNPQGRHKARLFEAVLGYTRENYSGLLEQIEAQALDAEAAPLGEDEYGLRLRVDLNVRGAAGQRAVISTGWIIPAGSTEARLITLYVRR